MAYSWSKNVQQLKVINVQDGQVYLVRSQLIAWQRQDF